MKAIRILGAALLATGAASAAAQLSSDAEYRGYDLCLDAAEASARGLVTSREYFLSRTAETNQYFINGTAWESGDRVTVRVACDTSRNGRELLDVAVDQGRFVLDDGQVDVRVAAN